MSFSVGLKNKKAHKNQFCELSSVLVSPTSRSCDPAGIRTQDPYIKSVLLYQLSYGIIIANFSLISVPIKSVPELRNLNFKKPPNKSGLASFFSLIIPWWKTIKPHGFGRFGGFSVIEDAKV